MQPLESKEQTAFFLMAITASPNYLHLIFFLCHWLLFVLGTLVFDLPLVEPFFFALCLATTFLVFSSSSTGGAYCLAGKPGRR